MAEFADIYDEHVWRVYGFIAYRVGSGADAQDLTQQTFERALRAWERFDPGRATHGAWLIAIARNLLIDHYRSRAAAPSTTSIDDVADGALGIVDGPEHAISGGPDLTAALAVLSERDREIVALRFGADLRGPEIAELTGLSLANVQQILSRSLRRMREELDKRP